MLGRMDDLNTTFTATPPLISFLPPPHYSSLSLFLPVPLSLYLSLSLSLYADEPTNHLDMGAIEALANALKGFSGGVLVISHDQVHYQ